MFRTKTNLPFDLFPDELVIDENQINVVHTRFFATKDIESILISQIKEVSVSTSLLYSSLTISSLLPNAALLKLDYLWPKDAFDARTLIQGLMAIQQEKIELSKIDTKILKERRLKIGHEKISRK